MTERLTQKYNYYKLTVKVLNGNRHKKPYYQNCSYVGLFNFQTLEEENNVIRQKWMYVLSSSYIECFGSMLLQILFIHHIYVYLNFIYKHVYLCVLQKIFT